MDYKNCAPLEFEKNLTATQSNLPVLSLSSLMNGVFNEQSKSDASEGKLEQSNVNLNYRGLVNYESSTVIRDRIRKRLFEKKIPY